MAGYSTPAWTNDAAPAVSAANLLDLSHAAEIAQHPYGVCSTAAATAAKTVTLNYSGTLSLFTGLCVRVKFSNSNSAANPTLNVNSTGAKSIKAYGTTAAGTWAAGQVIEFVYDGTNWLYDGIEAYTKEQSLSAATASAIGALTGTTPTTPDSALTQLVNAYSGLPKIKSGAYTGTGTYGQANPTSLTLPFAPMLLIVFPNIAGSYGYVSGLWPNTNYGGTWGIAFLWTIGAQLVQSSVSGGNVTQNIFTVNGNTISWYTLYGTNAEFQFNILNTEYKYLAIGV